MHTYLYQEKNHYYVLFGPSRTARTKEVIRMAMSYNDMLEKMGLARNSDPEDVIAMWDNLHDTIARLEKQLHDKDTELMISRENEDALQRRLNVIYSVMDEDIVKRMVDEIPTDDIVDLYARLKVGQ